MLIIQQKKNQDNVQNNSARTAAIYLFSSVLRFWLKTLQLARDAAEKLRFHSVGWLRHIFMDFKCSFSVFMSIEFCGSETFTCSVLWEKKWGWERGKKMRKSLVRFPLPLQTSKLIRGEMRWWQIAYTVGLVVCFTALRSESRTWLCCAHHVVVGLLYWNGWVNSQAPSLLFFFFFTAYLLQRSVSYLQFMLSHHPLQRFQELQNWYKGGNTSNYWDTKVLCIVIKGRR